MNNVGTFSLPDNNDDKLVTLESVLFVRDIKELTTQLDS